MAEPIRGSIAIEGESYETLTIDVFGKSYTVREISLQEDRTATAAATGKDGKVDGDLHTTILLSTAIIDPPTSADAVGKFGIRKWLTILRTFNELNTLPAANPTTPAGSPQPTSPDGGESSPETSNDSPDVNTSEWSDSPEKP